MVGMRAKWSSGWTVPGQRASMRRAIDCTIKCWVPTRLHMVH